jgi:hypothetical protein
MKIQPTVLFVFTALLICPSSAVPAQPLERTLQTVHLGMSPEDFQKAVPSIEMNELYMSLLPGERFFKVREDVLTEGIAEFTGRFYEEKLYKITVEYSQSWFEDEDWDALVRERMEKYGEVPIQEMQIRDGMFQTARWEDSVTVNIIRRQVQLRFKDNALAPKSTIFLVYLDKVLWEKRSKVESGGLF